MDVFHSRLSISPDGRHLATAGWLWHPWSIAALFDLTGPTPAQDGWGELARQRNDEVASVCWLNDDNLAVAIGTSDDEVMGMLGIWVVSAGAWSEIWPVVDPPGTIVAAGTRVVSLFEHPRLLEPATGAMLAEWPDIDAGYKESAFGEEPSPVFARHPDGSRLAIAQPDHIAVIDLLGS